MPSTLTEGQLKAVSAIERICSVFSLLGCIFMITTFCSSRAFRKPITRLVVYASFGNMTTNVATLMSRAYMNNTLSAGCQFQSYLIQTFMPADAFWTLAMAVNVYLTFYYNFDTVSLRRMEVPYLVLCYGVPMVPAFVFIFVSDSSGARVYGHALLWCWISAEWDIWRIYFFYGPVWVAIVVTFFIYIRVGRTIYESHKQLRDVNSSGADLLSINGNSHRSLRTTKVTVTSEAINTGRRFIAPFRGHSAISAPPRSSQDEENRTSSIRVTSRSVASARAVEDVRMPIEGEDDEDPANTKVTSVLQPISSLSTRPQPPPLVPRVPNHNCRGNRELNGAAWSYTRCAILFFMAILITWIPSSANRAYSIIEKNEVSVVLELMSAFVLPLQGFWNAIIYTVTSWTACKNLLRGLRCGRRPPS